MVRTLFAFLILCSTAANAARTEVAPMSGQARFFYDTTTREFGVELENKDAFRFHRDRVGSNVTLDEYGFVEHFDEGASKGLATLQLDGTAADGSTGIYNIAYYGRNAFVYAALGAGQTADILADANGLDITGDSADNEGYEVMAGVLGASGRPFIVGTDPAFYTCATVTIADVSDTDEFYLGFRRPETVNATYDNYLDLVSIGIAASAATAAIQIETIDDNAANVTTDTTDTWADAATKVLCIYVSSAGVVTYKINGAAPTVTAAVTIDDGDPMIPFIRLLHAASSPAGAVVGEWEAGLQEAD